MNRQFAGSTKRSPRSATPHSVAPLSVPASVDGKIPSQSITQYNEPSASDLLAGGPAHDPARIRTVSVKEAAFRLRKSPDSIYSWLRRGRLRGWQPGGHGCQIQVMESSIEQAMKNLLGGSVPVAKTA